MKYIVSIAKGSKVPAVINPETRGEEEGGGGGMKTTTPTHKKYI